MADSFCTVLHEQLKRLNVDCGEGVVERMRDYFELLTQANERMNLTRIVSGEDAAIKHFADSLSLLSVMDIPLGSRLIDIGTGGGFPAIPLKIAREDLEVTAVDATAKKLGFISSACEKLGIDVKLLCGRAEELGRDVGCRERYDVAVSRAVAPLNILLELCSPFVREGGILAAYKGSSGREEQSQSANAQRELGLKCTGMHGVHIDGHCILTFEKVGETPAKYPREYRIIKRKPL